MVENLLTYEENDPSEKLTVTATRVTWTDQLISQTAQVYYDKGADFFDGDFSHDLTALFTSGTTDGECYFWALTNSTALMRAIDTANGDYLSVYFRRSSTAYELYMEECDGGSLSLVSRGVFAATPYYLTIARNEAVGTHGTLYCYVYSDPTRETLIDTLSIALHSSKKDFRYIFALNSLGAGTTQKTSGYMENLSGVEEPPAPAAGGGGPASLVAAGII